MFVLFSFLTLSYYLLSHRRWHPGFHSCHHRSIGLRSSSSLLCPHPDLSTTHLGRQSPNQLSPVLLSILHFLPHWQNHLSRCTYLALNIWQSYHFIPSRCKTTLTCMKHVRYHSALMASLLPQRESLSLKFYKNNSNLPLGPYLLSVTLYLIFLDAYNFLPQMINA